MSKRLVVLIVLILLAQMLCYAQWKPLGPEGGDARSLAYDPRNPDRILLGTSAGQLFASTDGGRSWTRSVHFGERDDFVLDNISFDPSNPQTIYVAAWSVEETNGGVFRSDDGGKVWKSLPGVKGKSIRAFAIAESDPKTMFIGALDGVFRSKDRGETWEKITPDNHPDLRNFESIAIDRKDPNIVYAGTWHLPWKTTDGGKSWHNIKNGVIDDSDVFSIIIDRSNGQTVYASACSGIYRSDNSGELFHKIQGIPGSARRTRVLQQDPVNAPVVYAGTTEGLWKTVDGGKNFKRTTPPNYILNDVLVDPRNPQRVLIATDRGGVFASDDGGNSFKTSNTGFSHRQITSVVADAKTPGVFYVSMVNDKEFGGVFVTRDAGQTWSQMSDGLAKKDIFDLEQSSSGALLAATNRGLYRYAPGMREWESINTLVSEKAQIQPKPRKVKGKVIQPKPLPPIVTRTQFDRRALAVDISQERWFAATDQGVIYSDNKGQTWTGGAVEGEPFFVGISHQEELVAAITPSKLAVSTDKGAHWSLKSVPAYAGRLFSVMIDGNSIWLASRGGALRSNDGGQTWTHVLEGLPSRNVFAIQRGSNGALLATVEYGNTVYISHDHGKAWSASARADYALRRAIEHNGRIVAATAFNGIVASDLTPLKASK